jgi:hypothetical protein
MQAVVAQPQATQKKNREHNMPINNDAGTSTIAQPDPKPGPFLAKVVSNIDPTYMGILEVQILRPTGNSDSDGQLHQVKYMSPFYSATNVLYNGKDNDYPNTQKSSGMWMAPPDIGQVVMIFFIDGDPRMGYWMGCVPDLNANFMTPGLAATANNVEGGLDTPYGHASRVPVAEYNKNFPGNKTKTDATQINKPTHPFAQILADQGLLLDDIRGITTSSSRREAPSEVFGISTQGPIDKTGQKGDYGKNEYMVQNAPIDRMGGSTFVMDDGDDKFLRKKSPSEDGPNYAAVEEGETDGDVHRPHNELIRLRTRTGHQILLHNSEDLIYITNSRGTAWIELTSDGKIDIYSQDSISIQTENDLNLYTKRDFNLEVGRNFNTKVHGERHTNVMLDDVLIVDRDQKIHVKNRRDETIDEQLRQTVNDDVKMFYAKTYTHNISDRMDIKVGAVSVNAGQPGASPSFAPADATSQDPDAPVSNDTDKSSPVEDVNGPTQDKIEIKIFQDMVIQHVGSNIDSTVDGYVKLKVKGAVDVNTDSTYTQTSAGNLEIKSGGHIYNTSGGSNETNAGGSIIETAPAIHMNGPVAASASTAAVADTPVDARTSAKSTIPFNLTTNSLPGPPMGDEFIKTIMRRIPTTEPYPWHENLDPKAVKPDKTSRDIDGRYTNSDENSESMLTPPGTWKEYTTSVDTFQRTQPLQGDLEDQYSSTI